ncbi:MULTISPECIES: helix-turn-helix transcriptional regulator [unclassified Rhodococcus (in: high G+C Gram-positive bacteria)]|uniref:helix-turn-helix transcriptional regulator n=1 Tax=unclassified Rhodococcus (in: high G+C Gram-positive bacteria) TaxID=192944 RepID=UPI000E0B895D|nr:MULTISPECIES: helix-turn-helix transcriptional regulator [unclassified Rhodococcus (in: high G+C Gram-positive bacteria)]QKT11107.1 helix-turn-helix transcriptional regulator [Rhodococcus sp. W8901]RDI31361.1 regulatory LuxR family protein [Rhodococcus sp. AG1013]
MRVPTHTTALLRPRDRDALRTELRKVAATGIVPVVFGGEVYDGTLHLGEFVGTHTDGLRGLAVSERSGLGGHVVARRNPAAVHDYGRARTITHHYDGPVLAEGLCSVLAVPVVVRGNSRAVMYAAIRERVQLGDRIADVMMQAGRRLANEIAIRDEVDRRVQLLDAAAAERTAPNGADTEEIRDVHAELRSLAHTVDDPALQERLRHLSSRLAGVGSTPEPDRGALAVTLSPREVDVLSHAALGCSNAVIAERLSVKAETVKSYLRSAMSKLDAHSRREAVVAARRLGLLP